MDLGELLGRSAQRSSQQDVEKLHGGASVLAAGQLSDRWVIENGHTSRRGVIVATLLKAGPPPESAALFIAGGRP